MIGTRLSMRWVDCIRNMGVKITIQKTDMAMSMTFESLEKFMIASVPQVLMHKRLDSYPLCKSFHTQAFNFI